ncbi:hypothetical protein [Halopenitus persicus]|uniref:DUF8054 domain-containing protein n=1 Tax=Halopenitus persicus TaxID=1048396 RepID=A0A1H3ID11_9EURY|nr:hypothetical protein [Halopenitus persicus]SDY25591.1 hypothetical protein SAMN05216564_10478 [Halopenitus persicus]
MTGDAGRDPALADAPLPVPRGDLRRSRVVTDPAVVLRSVLEARLDGYLTLVPQETLLLGGDARAVVTFDGGVPTVAYNTRTERGGTAALSDVALTGPYRIEVYELPSDALDPIHGTADLAVPPGAPARELADDDDLAARTRERAPDDRPAGGDPREEPSGVEAFLADDDRIAEIREQARAEAADRAAEWGLGDLEADPAGFEADPDDHGAKTGTEDPIDAPDSRKP